jgi:rubrerythrin
MRVIDADEFERAMYHEAFENDASYDERNPMAKWESGLWIRYKMFENCLEKMPTIEPKRGEWIFKTVFPNDKSEFPMGYLVCSVCGSHHSNSTPCNYCDNCGADMRIKNNENN